MVGRRWPQYISDNNGKPRIRIKKHRIDETLEVSIYTKSGLKQATERRDWLLSRIRLDLPIREEGTTNTLFGDLAQDWESSLDVEFSTAQNYVRILNDWWMPEFSNHIASEITTAQIKKRLHSRSVKARTKKKVLSVIKLVLDFGDVIPNPAHFKVNQRDPKPKIERYRPWERDALLSMLDGQNQLYFAIMFAMGTRPSGEPLGLKWSDYDGKRWRVHQQVVRRQLKPSTKTVEDRFVEVQHWLKPLLLKSPTREKKGFVFLNSLGRHYCDADTFNLAWREAHERWNVRNPDRPIRYRDAYTCRHTRAAELLSLGVEPAEAAKQLGHTYDMFVNTYSEFIEEYCKEADPERFQGKAPEWQKMPKNCLEGEVVTLKTK